MKDEIKFIAGINWDINAIKLYPIGHTLIAGTAGSGKMTLVNSIIGDLVKRYSPANLNIVWLDACGIISGSPWANPNRRIAHSEMMNYLDLTDCHKAVQQIHTAIRSSILSYGQTAVTLTCGHTCIFVNGFDMLSESDQASIFKLCIEYSEFISLFAITKGYNTPVNAKLFTYAIVTRTTEECSKAILGTDIASTEEADKYGSCFIKSNLNAYSITKLYTIYAPDTYYAKYAKTFCSGHEHSDYIHDYLRCATQVCSE